MTTYTLTEKQREQLMSDAKSGAYMLLESLQPNMQDPVNIARVDAAMVEMRNIVPPLRRSECERLISAALSAHLAPQVAPLTDGQIDEIWLAVCEAYDETGEGYESHNFARAIEAAHGVKP